ncbi:uncharacterized protein A4U43_C06F8040 [Asparagus officinalis]|uniref:Uncharacterized protein n=1 Tax=Asparagus officinalis TaxID=4686 RepID=A0A5P1EKB0_ASPOF|nr:uncharacterized protein A4U43_C06F8040 [Asparagus officinalis]
MPNAIASLYITIRGTPHIVADIEIERESPQSDFNDINKEGEGPLPGEVPPTEDFPSADTTDIDTEREGPRLEEVPPPEADIFFEDEEVPLIIKMNKRKWDAKVPAPHKISRARRRMKSSNYVVTSYTEGKKKVAKEKQIFGGKRNNRSGRKGGRAGWGKEKRITAC